MGSVSEGGGDDDSEADSEADRAEDSIEGGRGVEGYR